MTAATRRRVPMPWHARTWRELGYWLTVLVLAAVGFVLVVLAVVSSLLVVVVVGIAPLLLTVLLARPLGRTLRAVHRLVLGSDIAEPPVPPPGVGPGTAARRVLGDPAGWRVLAYIALALPLAALTTYASMLLLAGGLFLVSCPAWWWLSHDGFGLLDVGDWPSSWIVVPAGVIAVLAAPWVLRAATTVDRLLAPSLLGPTREQRRLADVTASRRAEVDEAAAALQRLERDLHDTTQGRLAALGIAFGRIAARLDGQSPSVADLALARRVAVDGAASAGAGLAELRSIIAGIRPPALDAGLAVALDTLCASSAVPARLQVDGADVREAVAVRLYFSAAELLANVARHAHAGGVDVTLTSVGARARLIVTDDGVGGADEARGTGLAGLRRRLAALDGELTVVSPPGGPTAVTIDVAAG